MFGSAENESIGPYRVVRRLGFGRASEVLLATRKFPGGFERRVVIKRLLERCDDEQERQKILATEALAYSRVAHPAVVQLFDFFSIDGHLALVLEYVDGLSLERLLTRLRGRREAMSDRVVMYVASRLFAALAAAHAARDPQTGLSTPVIHRDVSPENVLVPWDGFVKLGDFDLAKVLGVSSETRSGLLKGTYGYMAPEQVLGDPVTPLTDVYAACLVLRELLVGRPAFDADAPELELLRAMEESRLEPIEALCGGVSSRLADAMKRGLARDPARRGLTAAEMVDVLRAQTDMESAHSELTAMLARVRPREERGTDSQRSITPSAGVAMTKPAAPPPPTGASANSDSRIGLRGASDTPRGVAFSLPPESVPPLERGPTTPPQQTWHSAVVGVIALAASVAAFGGAYRYAVLHSTPLEDVSSASVYVTPLAIDPPDTRVDSGPAAAAAPAEPAMGEIKTPAGARKHRVFLDGQLAAYESGGTLRVPCGKHTVRIGAAGPSQIVEVPCGGTVAVQKR